MPALKGARRRARSIMATDSEWQLIAERAEAAGLPISRYVVQRLTVPPRPPEQRLPLELQRRVARQVLVLSKLEELRFRADQNPAEWAALLADAEAEITAEEAQG